MTRCAKANVFPNDGRNLSLAVKKNPCGKEKKMFFFHYFKKVFFFLTPEIISLWE